MESTMEVDNCNQLPVQRLSSSFASHKTDPTRPAIPKRFWNLQHFPEIQQRKVGPHLNETASKNNRARLSIDVGNLHTLQCNDMENEDGYIDQESEHGLRRKAAKGLKRIITHFSLSDVNSLSGTPGLTSTSLSHHRHSQPPFHYDEENQYEMTSSEETSLDTLSTHEIEQPAAIKMTDEKHNALDHYRPRSHSALLMFNNITSLANRSLPPLPPTKLPASLNVKNHALDEYYHLKEKVHQAHVEEKFRQAVHWCRKPFHKFMSSSVVSNITTCSNPSFPQLMIQDSQLDYSQLSLASVSTSSTSSLNLNTPNQDQTTYSSRNMKQNEEQLPLTQESAPSNKKSLDFNSHFKKKKELRCRVIQITNIASSKEYQYELYVQLNGDVQASQSGIMKKITRGISAASPKESFSFEVSSPFSLTFTLCAKPVDTGLSKMKTFISKMDLVHQQQASSSPSSVSSSSLENSGCGSSKFTSKMPVVGSTCLLSGERFEAFSGKGLSRYTLIKPLESKSQKQLDEMNLELMVAFQLEDLLPSEPIGLSGLCTDGLDFDTALTSCHQGDYLTFYIRRQQFPTWNRYWVTLEHGQLYLRQFSNEHKGPIESIPLCELQSVCKPGEEIQEQVYFGRKHGIVLKFKTRHIQMDSTTAANNEHLEGYMYLFADSPQKASIWQTVFTAYASTEYLTANTSINARYLW